MDDASLEDLARLIATTRGRLAGSPGSSTVGRQHYPRAPTPPPAATRQRPKSAPLGGRGRTSAAPQAARRKSDYNNSMEFGSFQELCNLVGLKMMVKYTKLSDAFLHLDADRNGQITKTELRRFFRTCHVPDGHADQFFAYMDRDGSGGIDYYETRKALGPSLQPGPGNREQRPPKQPHSARTHQVERGGGYGPSAHVPKKRPSSARRAPANPSWQADYKTAFPPQPPNQHLDSSYMAYSGMNGEPLMRKVDRPPTECSSTVSTTASSTSSSKLGRGPVHGNYMGGDDESMVGCNYAESGCSSGSPGVAAGGPATSGAYIDDEYGRLLAVHTTRGGNAAGPVCFMPARPRYNRTLDSEAMRASMTTRTEGTAGLYDHFPSNRVMMRGGGGGRRSSGAVTERVPAGVRRQAFPDGRSELKDHNGGVIYIPGASGKRIGAPTALVDHAGTCIYGVEDHLSGEVMNSVMGQ